MEVVPQPRRAVQIVLPEELNTYDVLAQRLARASRRRTLERPSRAGRLDDEWRRRSDRATAGGRPTQRRRPNDSDPRDIIIRPVVSEKSYAAYDENVYTFVVAPDANKIEIRNAVEAIFGVQGRERRTRSTARASASATAASGVGLARPTPSAAIVSSPTATRIDIFGS